jgi:hypothetical protein
VCFSLGFVSRFDLDRVCCAMKGRRKVQVSMNLHVLSCQLGNSPKAYVNTMIHRSVSIESRHSSYTGDQADYKRLTMPRLLKTYIRSPVCHHGNNTMVAVNSLSLMDLVSCLEVNYL